MFLENGRGLPGREFPYDTGESVHEGVVGALGPGEGDAQRLDGEAHEAAWRSVREFGRSEDTTLVKLTCLPTDVARLVLSVESHVGAAPEIVARAGNGVVYVALPPEAGAGVVGQVVAEAIQRGGSGVVERAPLDLKRRLDVWGPTRGDFPLMQALKAQFDPEGVLNPGRFVGGI
jgi:glycolate oxidase FAD binding subunit